MTAPATAALPAPLRRRAAAVSARLAEKLHYPPRPELGEDRSPTSPRWRAQSLAKGATGVAVLHGLRAQDGLTGPETVHAWLEAATREPLSAGAGAGLWYGAAAVAFGSQFGTHRAAPGRYTQALQILDQAVTRLVRTRLEAAHARMNAAQRPSLSEYDLVRGLAGLGAYLLRRDPHNPQLRQVLAYLVRLTEPLPTRDDAGRSVPGWWTSDIPAGRGPDAFAAGHADLGMAHGVTGPLALLALAARAGVTVDGHVAAIKNIADWLEEQRQDGATGPWWPERLTLTDLHTGRLSQRGPRRPSWCYGTPGIARAVQLAGIATGDHSRRQRAEDALARCLADPAQLARLTDANLCHGWAGVATTTWHAAADACSDALTGRLPRLLQPLLDHTPAGQQPGLIEGDAGIAATLHRVTTGMGGWETCSLIT